MPSINRARPTAPTRLAETDTGDTFRSDIYHVEESDLFLIVDNNAKPELYDWVVVAQMGDDIMITLYQGQKFISVVRVLEFYQLTQSDQWTPRIHTLLLQLLGFLGSVIQFVA